MRIGALGALLHRDPGERLGVLADEGDDAARDVHGHDPGALVALRGVLDLPADGLEGHADEVAEQVHLHVVVKDVRGCHNGERRPVAHDLLAVAVEDPASRGGGVHGAGAVVLRLLEVVLARDELHRPEAREQDGKDAADAYGKAHEATRHGLLGGGVRPARGAGGGPADVKGEVRL